MTNEKVIKDLINALKANTHNLSCLPQFLYGKASKSGCLGICQFDVELDVLTINNE